MSTEIQQYFKDNSYVVIRKFLPEALCVVLYEYCKNKAAAADYKSMFAPESYNRDWDGYFDDHQAPGAYSIYGDVIMDSLLKLSHPMMQDFTGCPLYYNYSYWRLYEKNNDLKRHIDRESCEISTTLCIGYDVSNVDQNVYPDYDWPMWVKNNKTGEELPVHMKPGDMIIYRGCDVEHWREPFIGNNHAQVFMHYNDANGDYKIHQDNRELLGIPKDINK